MNEQQWDTQSDIKESAQHEKAGGERQAGESISAKAPLLGKYALQRAARLVTAGIPLGVLPKETLKSVVHSLGNSMVAGIASREMQVAELTSQALPNEFIGSEGENTVAVSAQASGPLP